MKVKRFVVTILCLTLLAAISGCAAPTAPARSAPATPERSAPATPARYELTSEVARRVETKANLISSLVVAGDYKAVAEKTSETTHMTVAQVEKKVSSLYRNTVRGIGLNEKLDIFGLGELIIAVDTGCTKNGINILTYTFDKNERLCDIEARLEKYGDEININGAREKASNIFKSLCDGKFDEVFAMVKDPKEIQPTASELKAEWIKKASPLGAHFDTEINLDYADDNSIYIDQTSKYENVAFDIYYEFSHQLELKRIMVYIYRFEAEARKVIELLFEKDFNAVAKKIKHPNTSINKREKTLKSRWKEVAEPLGKFIKYDVLEMDSDLSVFCSVECEKGELDFRIIFDDFNYDNIITDIEFGKLERFRGGAGKPVIYLYPEHDQQVQVKLKLKGDLSFSYPEYRNGWDVLAKPDGSLHYQGKKYSYLFWESDSLDLKPNFSEGFVVSREDTIPFLQKSLEKLGLTPREYNEFIVYWAPIMQKNAYNKVTFVQKEYTDAAALTITPQPDSILRVFMAFTPAEPDLKLKPQELKPFTRRGFTVVEWGGFQFTR